VRFLTSSTEGLAVYRVAIPVRGLPDWSSAEVTLTEVLHGRQVATFATRSRRHIFRLYTMQPFPD